ncbi:MAG: NUDIX domain-containing protein, partial [Candidatus Micrarchaeota archaeon]|nr:NUDIX domain-containing protein [Candidatus Micrarchaeota archaeon]
KAGHWDFSKGHVEANENEEQTARRELAEETGIRTATVVPGWRYEYVYEFGGKGRAGRSKKVSFMLAHTQESAVRTSHEHQGARWVPYSRAIGMLTFPNAKAMLESAEKFLNESKPA